MSPRWQAWFALGVIRLGLRPVDFWQLTLAEWGALLGVLGAQAGTLPDRAALQRLMRLFPDDRRGKDEP